MRQAAVPRTNTVCYSTVMRHASGNKGTQIIALIGLPASGKTTVGKLLASRLGVPFVDLDDAISAAAGMSPGGLIRARGEAAFRQLESRALAAACAGPACVVATGGGCVETAANRAVLGERATTVWLRVGPDEAASRAAGGDRPLLEGDASARMRELLARRESLYRGCADVVVDTEGRAPDSVAELAYDAVR